MASAPTVLFFVVVVYCTIPVIHGVFKKLGIQYRYLGTVSIECRYRRSEIRNLKFLDLNFASFHLRKSIAKAHMQSE